VAAVGKLVQTGKRQLYIKGKNAQNNTIAQNTQNRKQIKEENKHKKNIKKLKSSNWLITNRSR
jgi:hypothetical protein